MILFRLVRFNTKSPYAATLIYSEPRTQYTSLNTSAVALNDSDRARIIAPPSVITLLIRAFHCIRQDWHG
jgi:hypothetical protein